ncbi:MAG TPA: response regulator transcription factor [Anaerolineales bacterium]|nr:response regulator transcription factor [Anaerolineales bacterium]
MPINVLIADDHVFYREGVRTFLSNSPEIDVVGEAGNGDEAIARANELQPDVILMDLKMPGTNGIEATRRIHEASPNVGVLVLTMFDDDDSVFAAMRAGARGYLLKDADKDDVVRAIVAVERGEAIFSPAIAQRMIQYFSTGPSRTFQKNQPVEFTELTERELEILDLIAQGHNNLVISNKLSLSIKTVQNYVSSILTKLQVADRSQAIVRAREAGLGKKDSHHPSF